MSAPRLLHLFATFDPGGPQVRQAALFAALGDGMRHAVVALDGRLGCAPRLPASVEVVAPGFDPRGRGAVRRLRAFLRNRPHDLCVTYNWGAFDALRAALREGRAPVLVALDGFNPEEAGGELLRRRLARRLYYRRAAGVVVPSHTLEALARSSWKVPAARLHLVSNGVDLARFAPGDRASARIRLGLPRDAVLVGAVGGLRPVKDQATLVRAFAASGLQAATLMLAGDGPDRAALEALGSRLGLGGRLVLLGAVDDTSALYPALDVLAFSSLSEQQPMAALEGMACGLPLCGTAVGDLVELCGDPALCVAPRDVAGLAAVLARLGGDAGLRADLGRRNRERAAREFGLDAMVAAYRDLYLGLVGARG